ncbi:Dual specificity protein phosphatase PPS1 [Spathaspora sp. JA1]|nr:Dual specificity protein phosphatase PPS1 [Spathaspora sp. JA1]
MVELKPPRSSIPLGDDLFPQTSTSLPTSPIIHTTTILTTAASHSSSCMTTSSLSSSSTISTSANPPPASSSIPLVRSSSAIDRIPYKRSSSSSNDLIYERDRFRVRSLRLNDTNDDEIYDGIGVKTAKLNIGGNPLDPTSSFYQQLSKVDNRNNIFQINVDQLYTIFQYYFNTPLPKTNIMFPWLHGLHKDNYAQKSFFLYQQQQLQKNNEDQDIFPDFQLNKPTNIRFLMCITDEEPPPITLLKNTVNLTEILTKIDISRSEIVTVIKNILGDNLDLLDVIISDCVKLNVLPIFLNLDPDRGISLRNFHIQVSKLSTCSDFILYGNNRSKLESMARVLWLAQRNEREQQQEVNQYNVFILDDVITTNDPVLSYNLDFKVLERLETTKMSSATKIYNNVWIGNTFDQQTMMSHILENKPITPIQDNLINVYNDPKHSIIASHNTMPEMYSTTPPRSNWRLFIQCHIDALFPSLSTLSHLLFMTASSSEDGTSYHALEFPPSGSIGIGDCKGENLHSIVNTCKLLYYSSSTSSPLIYCSDGYTESSLLVLCYLIYSQDVPLEQAILNLHLTYGRPFYIFNSDVIILRKLQPLLRKFSPRRRRSNPGELDTLTNEDLNEILLGPIKIVPKLGHIHNSSDDDSSDEEEDEQIMEIDWVKEVEGSIPSKILPYLYLGSLKHASCLPLLNKLEITHIISVGENLPWLNGYRFLHHNQITKTNHENIEIAEITPKDNLHHHHHTTTVKSVMKVNDLEDDGIDELAKQLPYILDFINQQYLTNGKILVHCRVGVSRSATVVIAEIMRRLQLSLPQAYLFTRVRRLNIIIQPNLRFMYELFKWEEQEKLSQKQARGEYIDGTVMLREIDWFIMCREIMKLNKPYLTN